MLKLENWGDLFKFNKELLDDDYNRDQSLVVKAKTKSIDGTSVILLNKHIYNEVVNMYFVLFRN
jgi:hypothetical protein